MATVSEKPGQRTGPKLPFLYRTMKMILAVNTLMIVVPFAVISIVLIGVFIFGGDPTETNQDITEVVFKGEIFGTLVMTFLCGFFSRPPIVVLSDFGQDGDHVFTSGSIPGSWSILPILFFLPVVLLYAVYEGDVKIGVFFFVYRAIADNMFIIINSAVVALVCSSMATFYKNYVMARK